MFASVEYIDQTLKTVTNFISKKSNFAEYILLRAVVAIQLFSVFGNAMSNSVFDLFYPVPLAWPCKIQFQHVTQDMIRNTVFKYQIIADSHLLLVGKFIVFITFQPQSVRNYGIQANHQS